MADDHPQRAAATMAVHAGEPRRYAHDALTAPIFQTATYSFASTQELRDFFEGRSTREEYGRYGNPTVRVVEEKVAALEGADDAIAFASGMAAVTTAILALTKSGSHVVLFSDCYRRTRQFVGRVLGRFGVEHTLVPPADLDALRRAIRPGQTRLVISEAPTNPYNTVVDIDALSTLCREQRVKTMIDATFATPINLRPLEHGVDLVVHSGTKYFGGHNDVLAGVLAGPTSLISLVRDLRHVLGGVMDPHAAYLLLRGLKTLELRVQRQNRTAQQLAAALDAHPRVKAVYYPGLPSHPQHAVAQRLMRGFGGVVTFALDTDLDGASRFVDTLQIPRIAPSLGGVESLVEQPALMSYYELSTEERLAIGIPDELIRYAVGLEDPDELIADVLRSLNAV